MVNHRSSCDQIVAEFVIERYAAGQLTEAETAAFEAHLLTCDRCQRELTLAIAVRESLAEAEAVESDEKPAAPGRLPWRRMAVGLTLAAAAVAALLLIPRERVSSEFAELGRVTQPPVYLGVPVRQAPARPDSVFAEAMALYAAGDFGAAADGLARAVDAGAGPIPAEFFRGASLMMLDRPDEAEAAFAAVIEAGDSPYLSEAHFYRAKALLHVGRAGEAQAELQESVESADSGSEIAAAARALADSLEARMGG
jgi:tetratricopeptide (TPR) repeat protein